MPQSPTTPFSGIFVSYRRDDSSGHAGRLYDNLATHFGDDQIFMDIDTIEPGEDFVQVIENAVGSCEILIVMIGRQWLSNVGETTRRLDNPNDFVRLEITTALKRNIRVIPVLVQRTTMPSPQDLPEDIARLSRRNAIELSDTRWQYDVAKLIKHLEKVLASREEARLAEAARQEEEERRSQAEATRRAEEEKQIRLAEEAKLRAAEEYRLQEEKERKEAEERERLEAEEAVRRRAEEERVRAEAEARKRAEQEAERHRVKAEEEAERLRLEEEKQARAEGVRRRQEAAEATRRSEEERRVSEARLRELNLAVKQKQLGESATEITAREVPPPAYWNRRVMLIALGALVAIAIVVAVALTGQNGSKQQTGPTPSTSPTTLAPQPPPGMVYVPGGEFTMGRDDGDEYERPAHRVTVKPFFVDVYEVTCADYDKFIKEKGHSAPPGWETGACPPGAAGKPVTGVTWYDADAFCRARGKRLPNEEEWEFAARGTDGRRYPWGNEWRAGSANAQGASNGVVDVGSNQEGKSLYGAFDMVGNAWEWTASRLTAYQGGHIPPPPFPGEWRVIRGGSHLEDKNEATATYRRGYPARGTYDYGNTGFRCAKEAADSTIRTEKAGG